MADQGEQLAQQILNDLACPGCEYNLRGLRGPLVNCPECGLRCDIPRMIARQWTRPWWEAPGFNRLIKPLAWLVLTCCGLFLVLIIETVNRRGQFPSATIGLGGIVISIWVLLLARARRQFENDRGLILALFLHMLFAGYLLGVIGTLAALIRGVYSGSLAEFALYLPLAAALIVLLVFCRRGERYVAQQCIKRYLRMCGDDANVMYV